MRHLAQQTPLAYDTEEALPTGKVLRLYVDRLVLTDFRSYERTELHVGAHNVVLSGPNGAGKTNLLEALSFLSPGRGMRGSKLTEITRIGAQNWAVASTVMTPAGNVEVGSGFMAGGQEGANGRRLARIDGENASSPAALGDILQVAWLTPQMDRLFIEGLSGRRQFLDRLVGACHANHSREVNAYERLMRERNKLLADGPSDPAWLGALEGRMAEHAVAVAAARLDALDLLSEAMEKNTSCFPKARLALDGLLEAGLRERPAVEVEEDFRKELAQNRAYDASAGRATSGPHKTDFLVTHADKNMPAGLCSTGEQKALLIGITLASARLTAHHFGAPPLLLLDEVAAHLDHQRRNALYGELDDIGSQVWLTGTDRSLFDEMKGRRFTVENGQIRDN